MIEIINPEDIPKDLPPGEYTTEIVSAHLVKNTIGELELDIKVKYVGKPHKLGDCLMPLVKHSFVKEATE